MQHKINFFLGFFVFFRESLLTLENTAAPLISIKCSMLWSLFFLFAMLDLNKSRNFERIFSCVFLVMLEIGTSMLVCEIPLVFNEVTLPINLLFLLSTNKLKCVKKSIPIIRLLTSAITKSHLKDILSPRSNVNKF